MRGWRQGLGMLLAVLLGALGCASPNIAPRPPKHPDEIVVPPVAEGRFSTPPVYPEPANLNNDPARSHGGQPNPAAMGPGMGGMGSGMGGMGPGMGGMMMGGMGGNGGYNAGGYGR